MDACRLGVGVPRDSGHDVRRSLALLGGAVQWCDWASNGPAGGGYCPTLYRHFGSDVRLRMKQQPHETWLIGNEPERAEQSNKHYSHLAWDVREAMKLGVSVVAPNVHWIDNLYVRGYCQQFVWSVGAEQMRRLRAFGVHLYETTPLTFDMAVHQVRKFLNGMGLQSLPIWVTECDATPVMSPMRQATLLRHVHRRLHEPTATEAVDALERAFWFSANYSRIVDGQWVVPASNLITDDGQRLTALGQEFRRLHGHHDRSADAAFG